MPVFQDFYELIKKDKKLKKFAPLLKPYISGSLKYLNVLDKGLLIFQEVQV